MSSPLRYCRSCGVEYEHPEDPWCPVHPDEELTAVPAGTARPAPEAEEPQRRTVCWKCRRRTTTLANDSCTHCHESLVPPALAIAFPNGTVVVRRRSESADLGRAGAYGHVFESYPNVSRAHASVGVDADGNAWLAPDPAAPNGTFVNGVEIRSRTCVNPGDLIRFAAENGRHIGPTSEPVRLPQREPTAAAGS